MPAILSILLPILKDLLGKVLEMFLFTEKTEIKETEYYARGPQVPRADQPSTTDSGPLFDDERLV